MKTLFHLLPLSLLIGATSAFALDALPNGHWTGGGHGAGQDGTKFQYTEELTIKDNTATWVLDENGSKMVYVLKHTFKAGNFLDVSIEEQAQGVTKHGTGYCASVWCHVQSDDHSYEMTYVFEPGGAVYELGADSENGASGWFESELKPANSKTIALKPPPPADGSVGAK